MPSSCSNGKNLLSVNPLYLIKGLRPSYCDAEVVDPYKDVVSKSAISFSKTLFKSFSSKMGYTH